MITYELILHGLYKFINCRGLHCFEIVIIHIFCLYVTSFYDLGISLSCQINIWFNNKSKLTLFCIYF